MSESTISGAGGRSSVGLDAMTAFFASEGRREAPATSSIDVAGLCGTVVPALVTRRTARPSRLPPALLPRVEAFLTQLIDEDDDGCDAFIMEQAALTGDPQDVASAYLGPAARLLGDYWRMDVCDFMKVTVVMARIQRLFWRLVSLYPPHASARADRSALLCPMPEEQHSFGLAVVEDALRRAGWHVDHCGVDEEETYWELLGANAYAFVGVTASGTALASALPRFIRKSRKKSLNSSVRIVLGGSLFVEKPGLAYEAGADFLALDAPSAVHVAEAAASAMHGS